MYGTVWFFRDNLVGASRSMDDTLKWFYILLMKVIYNCYCLWSSRARFCPCFTPLSARGRFCPWFTPLVSQGSILPLGLPNSELAHRGDWGARGIARLRFQSQEISDPQMPHSVSWRQHRVLDQLIRYQLMPPVCHCPNELPFWL